MIGVQPVSLVRQASRLSWGQVEQAGRPSHQASTGADARRTKLLLLGGQTRMMLGLGCPEAGITAQRLPLNEDITR